ncbi:MAG: hypothetical protein A2889_08765 [Nitrospinae bacterium RIFCSPLOWO2_01_FULL_39_10]|nr:MAG: hypothetical protein A2889_08765 [Nitrospinae bacterium RIFCSPLOWO2_01_FULL_39_10]
MQKIPLNLAKPGMRLAKAVLNEKGLVLCGEGVELNDALISRLSNLNINKITVEGHPVDTGAEEKPLEEQIQDLEKRFEKVKSDPLMKMIKSIFEKQIRLKKTVT